MLVYFKRDGFMKIIQDDKVYIQLKSLLFLASFYGNEKYLSMYFNSIMHGLVNDDFLFVSDELLSNEIINSMFVFDYMDSMEFSIDELNVMLDSLDDINLEGKDRLLLIHKRSDLEDMIRFRREGLPSNFIVSKYDSCRDVFRLLKKDN
mgnify:CR=1 FL=1